MPKYYPIDVGLNILCSGSNLVGLNWAVNTATADFSIWTNRNQTLRVSFHKECIFRVLDEMPLSTENDLTPNEGLVREHFAYRVEGAVFSATQSEAWRFVVNPQHYGFITGAGCLDALTAAHPMFEQLETPD
jgi:hypothetical protein